MIRSWLGRQTRNTHSLSQRLGWIAITTLLVALVTNARAASPPASRLIDFGPARTLAAPAFWIADGVRAVVWSPVDAPKGLVLQPLDGSPAAAIIPYTDIHPQHWRVAPAGLDSFHLVWLESNGRLQSALIDANGTTIRGPVELVASAGSDFALVPQGSGAASVVWASTRSRQITSVRLDSSGRPGPIRVIPTAPADHLAVAHDDQNRLHIAWLTPTEPQTWTISAAVAVPDSPLTGSATAGTITVKPEELISSFEMGLTPDHRVLVIGTTHASQPDVEQLSVFVLPLDTAQEPLSMPLLLPSGCPAAREMLPVTRASNELPPTPSADLRWPRVLPGSSAEVTLAAACHTAEGWRPVIISITVEGVASYHLAAHAPLDVAPPVIATDVEGDISLAWIGLSYAQPHFFVLRSDLSVDAQQANRVSNALAAALRGLLAGAAIGWLWLLFPTGLIYFFPHNPWTIPMALMLFGASQLLWPPELFTTIPPTLGGLNFDRGSPGIIVGGAVLLVGICASAIMILAYKAKTSANVQWLAYGLSNTVMLWTIFGSNLF